jgi:hypothetical protein
MLNTGVTVIVWSQLWKHLDQRNMLAEPERSSSFPINREQNDPGNAWNEMNPGNDQAHFVCVKMLAIMWHEIGHDMIK